MNLRAFFSRGHQSNVYLIEDEKIFLIDAGLFPTGIEPDIIFLTHCHFDHIERAKEIQQKTGAEIWMSKVEADFFEENRSDASASRFFGSEIDLDFKIHKKLKDGDLINLGATNLQVILTPGHTPGGTCLYDSVSKFLFSGDTIFSSGFGRYDLLGGSIDELRKSVKKLSELNVQKLYPAHGPALTSEVNRYIKSIYI